MTNEEYLRLATKLINTVHSAGQVEMEVFRQDFQIEFKEDESPVTNADRAAEEIIIRDLNLIAPDVPVVAEEAACNGHIPDTQEIFFLVDPLDGTKEFVQKSGEFTVNIALIANSTPVFSLIYAPVSGQFHITIGQKNAVTGNMDVDKLVPSLDKLELRKLSTYPPMKKGLRVIASKSHMTEKTREFLKQFEIIDIKSAGSSMKFCLLAENQADLYPRFGPTMEWDTAAGHAILLAAGGQVVTEDGKRLAYGKKQHGFHNPNFIAWGRLPLLNP